MMFKKIFFGMAALALFSACTEDYKDWAEPQTNQEVPTLGVELAVAPQQSAAVDLATIEGETVKLFSAALPAGMTVDSYNVKLTDTGTNSFEAKYADWNLTADADGNVKVEDLQNATNGMFNKEAVERSFNALVSANVNVEGQTGSAAIALAATPFVLTVIPVAPEFAEFIWMAGNSNGWGSPADPLFCANGDGKYEGYMWLDGEFKFRSHETTWDAPDWGSGGADGTLEAQAGNLSAAAGFYRVNVDLVAMTYSIMNIYSIGIIGGFNGWGGDVEMTYNNDEKCWEATTELDGEFKFRANNDWAINWGGSFDNLTQDGSNLSVDAGTYNIKLYITYVGNHHAVITKQ